MTVSGDLLICLLIALPLVGTGLCALPLGSAALLRLSTAVSILECAIVGYALFCKTHAVRIFALGNNMFIDTLSMYHICMVAIVFLCASLYAQSYFAASIKSGSFTPKRARRFTMLWNAFFAILVAVLCSNNMGILWICLEASTLVSALLIMTNGHSAAIEAMWKYVLLCSIGIAFAFVGTLLLSVAAHTASFPPHQSLLWTALYDRAGVLNGKVMCAAFIFILVGFGTKAGLAPMHTWLPDAHSQSPTPVSAVFSGVMLNCALYCIMRYLPLCEASMGHTGRAHAMLIVFGLASILIGAVFIPSQKNIKRLLAYCSIEHIGIITLGLGIGGLGTLAALLHTFNHSIAKSLAFITAGRLGSVYGTHDMTRISGVHAVDPLHGTALLISILALFGAAPFSIFMSEFQLVKAFIDTYSYVPLILFLFCSVVVFISAIGRLIAMWGGPLPQGMQKHSFHMREFLLVSGLSLVLLIGGLYLPQWYTAMLRNAADIIEGTQHLYGSTQGFFQ